MNNKTDLDKVYEGVKRDVNSIPLSMLQTNRIPTDADKYADAIALLAEAKRLGRIPQSWIDYSPKHIQDALNES